MDKLANGQELTNPLDETTMHWETCRNCGERFVCCDPTCLGGASTFDVGLCPDCSEALEGIW